MSRDRKALLRASPLLNGIDFVEVMNAQQTALRVHFVNATPLIAATSPVTITGGLAIPEVAVTSVVSATAQGRPVLDIIVAAPGDFSTYTLAIDDALLDPWFAKASFSFKVDCPSDFDCAHDAPACPPPALTGDEPLPQIDYLAKDFDSFRDALFAYSARRFPEARERALPDLGVMLAEALAALGDDLSYLQDRIAHEATLETATERLSIVRHARLVDYAPRPATSAFAWLAVTVRAGVTTLPRGLAVFARRPDGGRLVFEIGEGLYAPTSDPYPVRAARNDIPTYYWDDSEQCLAAGSTELWLDRIDLGFADGDVLILDTRAASVGGAPLRERVVVASSEERPNPLEGRAMTRVVLRAPTRLPHALGDVGATPRTIVHGNVVFATQGATRVEQCAVGGVAVGSASLPRVLTRLGIGGAPVRLWPLGAASEAVEPLAWLALESARPWPEVRVASAARRWGFAPRLIEARSFDHVFTVEPTTYRDLGPSDLGWPRPFEYDGDRGDTLRFGDGTFGAAPHEGETLDITYRTTAGAGGNVPADTIAILEPGGAFAALAERVTNPFAAEGGADREPNDDVRRDAPEAFRAHPLRVVRPEDYRRAAEELAWVQRAGARFRWTGSWITAFTAVDPRGSTTLSLTDHIGATRHLDRRRLAGRESFVTGPTFVSLDLVVTVCAKPDAVAGDVAEAVLGALVPSAGGRGFFHPDRLTFGAPLVRGALEAAIDRAPGVDGVLSITYRMRGKSGGLVTMPAIVAVGTSQILRVDADPSRPEHGSIKVTVEGGR